MPVNAADVLESLRSGDNKIHGTHAASTTRLRDLRAGLMRCASVAAARGRAGTCSTRVSLVQGTNSKEHDIKEAECSDADSRLTLLDVKRS